MVSTLIMGVGGAGIAMIAPLLGLEHCDIWAANTDKQALEQSDFPNCWQLGSNTYNGQSVGTVKLGRKAAQESIGEFSFILKKYQQLILVGGLGGGTATGAIPVVLQKAQKLGVKTSVVVTLPFHFESKQRQDVAHEAAKACMAQADNVTIYPLQELYQNSSGSLSLEQFFTSCNQQVCDDIKKQLNIEQRPHPSTSSRRQVVMDIETTGLDFHTDKIIELACVECVEMKPTGRTRHWYFDPKDTPISQGSMIVHGLTSPFLEGMPSFADIVEDFMAFISGADLVLYHAPFDLGFLNNALEQLGHNKKVEDYCQVFDVLQLAKKRHPDQRNGLDALYKRYGIDTRTAPEQGAFIDAQWLAKLYQKMLQVM